MKDTTSVLPLAVAAPTCSDPPSSAPGAGLQPSTPHAQPAFTPARGESARAFEAFRVYLELGPARRCYAVGQRVGVSLRTIKRWAADFDWRGRIRNLVAREAEQFAAIRAATQGEECLDAARREQAFRDRQYAVAEGLLLAAERYLERLDEHDLDQMNFGEACKALDVASRLGRQVAGREVAAESSCPNPLRDQLAALLDQAYAHPPTAPGVPPTAAN